MPKIPQSILKIHRSIPKIPQNATKIPDSTLKIHLSIPDVLLLLLAAFIPQSMWLAACLPHLDIE